MAIIKNGILGGFSGKAGAVVGYRLYDQDVMRGRGNGRKKPFTPDELENQKKFAASQAWLQPIIGFLRVGFKGYTPRYEGFVAAKSYNSKHAMKLDDNGFYVDPELALLSYGKLDLADTVSAVSESPATVTFRWSGGNYKSDDRAMLLLYDVERKRAVFDTAAAKRQRHTAVLELNQSFSGRTVHAYLAFISEDRNHKSNSQYLGVIKVL